VTTSTEVRPRSLSFWQRPWVQNVLPLVTSLALHAAVVVVAVLAYSTVRMVVDSQRLEEQPFVPSSALIQTSLAEGVKRVGLEPDPTRPPTQDEFPESADGWAPKPGASNAQPTLIGGGEAETTDAIIGPSPNGDGFRKGPALGPGAGDGRGPLAVFGPHGGGADVAFINIPGGEARTVVFVCDASGSMINTFGSLKAELVKAVSALKAVRGFNIVFFQDEKAAAFAPDLVFATPENKRKADKWLDTVTTTGTTNPIPGLEQAFRSKPQLIYLLTDGDFPDNEAVKQAIRRLNKDKQTKINTILFTSGDAADDASESLVSLMKSIAKDSGGVFSRVKESDLK